MNKRVLSLFDFTGNMVEPWLFAGSSCVIVDIQHPVGEHVDGNLTRVGSDIATWVPNGHFDLVFAFPPCTHLSSAGAWKWQEKGPGALKEALELVNASLRIIREVRPRAWMIENPRGRLSTYWRKPDHIFQPCDYGGYLSPPRDIYTKRTCLWTSATFRMPPRKPVKPVKGDITTKMSSGNARSVTPRGFAYAVWEANR